jgi:hypothetical protein
MPKVKTSAEESESRDDSGDSIELVVLDASEEIETDVVQWSYAELSRYQLTGEKPIR